MNVQDLAKKYNIPYEALQAVINVETTGTYTTRVGNKDLPIIRYEGHYFDRLCNPKVREEARKAGVSSPKAGGVKNPKSQVDRWNLLGRASVFDKTAALESCSYGVGQVMGANWKSLGFKSVDEFVTFVCADPENQLDVMCRFITTNGLDKNLRNLDWSGFARKYNGPNYRKNKYDTKLAAEYKKLGGTGTTAKSVSGLLRSGSKGAGVRELQKVLILAGYNIVADGDFGPSTEDAVKGIQKKNDLSVDGIVGPKTQSVLAGIKGNSQIKPEVNDDMKIGAAAVAGTPIGLSAVSNTLQEGVDKVSSVPALGFLADWINAGIGILLVVGVVIGIWYFIKGVRARKYSYTGSKSEIDV